MVVWTQSHPREALAVAIYIHTPFIILSLPWSFIAVFIEPSLRDSFTLKTLEYLSDVIGLLAVLFNIFWLLNKYSFAKLLIWLWSLAGIQGVLALFLV